MTTITTTRTDIDVAASSDWGRAAALGGVAFVALGILSTFLAGAPPASDASAATITTYFSDHASTIEVANFLGGLGTVGLLFWFASLWRRLQLADDGRTGLPLFAAVSFVMGIGLAMLNGVVTVTAASQIDSIGDGSQLLYRMGFVAIGAAGFGIAGFIVAVCIVNGRGRFLPAWTNYVGAAAAVAFLVGTFGLVTDANAVNTFDTVAFLVWCVWILAISTTLWRRAEIA